MAKTLTVNNVPYQYPGPDADSPGWGEEATGWAEEVTDVLNNLIGPGDILETSFTIPSIQATFIDIAGLAFDTNSVRSASVEYSIYRRSDSETYGNAESGKLELVYDTDAPSGSKWLINQYISGDAGVYFDITDNGQLQYKADEITGTNYSGVLKFKATALNI